MSELDPVIRDAALQRLRRVSADRLRELEQVKLERDLAVKRADAATAAVGRVRAALGEVLPDWSDNGVVAVADILAALDGGFQ